MKASIITACYNSSRTIEDTINSVLCQDYQDIEYIVVDGGSNDDTHKILVKHQDKISHIISERDNGVYDAMNKGIKLTTGHIVGFLNADDFYASKSTISQVVNSMQQNDYEAVYGDLLYVDQKDTNKVVRYWRTGKYKKGAFRLGWVIPHPTFFCRRELFDEFGYFNEKFQIAADFELMLRLIEKHQIKIGYIPQVLVKMRRGGKANILKGMIRGNMEIIRSFHLNNLYISPLFFIYKPIIKISQLLIRPGKPDNSKIDL
jgi:glycosyltransferase involved in cell wall biosynthesis